MGEDSQDERQEKDEPQEKYVSDEQENEGRTIADTAPLIMIVGLFLGGFVIMMIPASRNAFLTMLDWCKGREWTAAVYCGVMIGATLLGLPVVLFVVAAGYTWHYYAAVPACWIGGILGALIAFLLGRNMCPGVIERLFWSRGEVIHEINELLSDKTHGWKWMIILRVPFVPFGQLSYILSGTDIELGTYMWTTAAAMIPGCLLYTYVGNGLHHIQDLINGGGNSTAVVAVQAGSIVLCIIIIIGITLVARQKVKAAIENHDHDPHILSQADNNFLDDEENDTKSD